MFRSDSSPPVELIERPFVSMLPPIRSRAFRVQRDDQVALACSAGPSDQKRQNLAAVRRLSRLVGVRPRILLALFSLPSVWFGRPLG
jgi:hypothetical protein